jgi:hypothetical protein
LSIEQLDADAQTAHSHAIVADVAFSIAAAGAATLATILLVRSSHSRKKMETNPTAQVGVQPASVTLRF